MTLNGNFTFGELAKAGVFHDFANDPVVEDVSPAILKILTDLGVNEEGQVNGLPFANNADGVIYNKDLFAENGVEAPTTWEEMLTALETFEEAGVTPVYGTLQDAWTSLPAWNALASNLPPDDFYPMLRDDAASFQENYVEVAQRMNTLFEFAQDTKFERNYNAGNEAFAQGEAAMYLQGSWAIPVIKGFEPDFEVGTFAYPTDSPEDTAVVSGVDVALTMDKDTPYAEEAMTFIEYLMSPDVMTSYVEEQSAIPTLKGLETPEPALEGLAPYFEDERVVGFSDHQIPPAIPLAEINQQFLISGNREAYLSELDEEWNKVARRQY
jgi:raffinose/stachyose/melibiose transport system substrate-binding protein